MKLIFNKQTSKSITEITPGQLFELGDEIFMKIKNDTHNAISLQTYTTSYVMSTTKISPLISKTYIRYASK